MNLISRIGVLRVILLTATLICLPLVYFADVEPVGLGIISAYVAPAMSVIFLFLLMLDALMNRIFMIDTEGEELTTRRIRMWLDLAAVGGIILFWGPFFRSIGQL